MCVCALCAVIYLDFFLMILFLVDSQVLSDSSSEDDEVEAMEGMLNKKDYPHLH